MIGDCRVLAALVKNKGSLCLIFYTGRLQAVRTASCHVIRFPIQDTPALKSARILINLKNNGKFLRLSKPNTNCMKRNFSYMRAKTLNQQLNDKL